MACTHLHVVNGLHTLAAPRTLHCAACLPIANQSGACQHDHSLTTCDPKSDLFDHNVPHTAYAGSSTPYTLPLQETDPFSFDILGIALLHLTGQALVFGAAAVLLDAGLLQRLGRSFTTATKRKHTERPSADIIASSTAPADKANGVGAGKDSCVTGERGKAADSTYTAAACGGSYQQAMVSAA